MPVEGVTNTWRGLELCCLFSKILFRVFSKT